MSLDAEKLEIVKASAPVLKENSTEIGKHFYELLFERVPELSNVFNQTNQKRGLQQEALVYSVYAAGENIDSLENINQLVERIAEKHVSLGVKPDQYPVVGEALIQAVKDVLGKAATDEIIDAWTAAYDYIANLFIEIEQKKYRETEEQEGGWTGFREFVVEEKIQETDDVVSFCLKPKDGKPLATYKAGQYLTLKADIDGEPHTHMRQYSLSGASGKDHYKISVKREKGKGEVPDGVVSNYLHDQVAEGDMLEFSAPAGDFTITSEKEPIVLLSGGIGVTPVVGMLDTLAEKAPDRPVTFIHATQNSSSHAMKDHVEQMAADHPNISSFVCYDSPNEEDRTKHNYDKEGYVNLQWLQSILSCGNQADFYCCGPAPFMKAVDRGLKDWGVSSDYRHYEVFNPVSVLNEA
ncbi:NO-inducible flavohemoprotein [Lentibacillus sp. CBA3610]|uniref:NO-inducible flavohemoprotein n=1 Tax=Lentibacillus sp. CBA3610 TaxID=2518176 RepID=UPI0015951502|nr:NO-inducible flavohemoprotein [Lentibacillus sp. CBA3610]QKY70096.1 NO-inducible flavohemoprotein [Lentibacillus sp. CBA3610]